MTIKEMEEQIDKLNLEKLEVKMKKGRQVHFFICGDPESYDEDCGIGNLIVFDEVGHAWILPQQKYDHRFCMNLNPFRFQQLHQKLERWIRHKQE